MSPTLPSEAWLCALAGLPAMTPARLRGLLAWGGSPEAAWAALASGRTPPAPGPVPLPGLEVGVARESGEVRRSWVEAAADIEVEACWERHRRAGIGVVAGDSSAMPEVLAGDVDPPVVLFHRGGLDRLAGARAAVVGTRRCSAYGRQVAFELGRDLASAGVGVVSGLAAGIDAAAHRGALHAGAARPVAVVGTGVDRSYPRSAAALWEQVASVGVVLSEHPAGTGPRPWHFPVRNRLLAALADVVVVVESRERGGALITATEATRRDRPVLAVPGPVTAPASRGTNDLVADGAGVARDVGDVLVVLGLTEGARRRSAERRPSPEGRAARALDALGWQPATLDQLAARLGQDLDVVVLALEELRAEGWVAERSGWWERCPRPDR